MPLISVIIPVYNSEKYLRECLDSVVNQSFKDFEVLLINDGSTDSSGEICNEYKKKDSRVKVFHKKNGGVSSARNLGLENSKGEWIAFVDSDDFISDDYFGSFYKDNLNNFDWIFLNKNLITKNKNLTSLEEREFKIIDFLAEYPLYSFFTPWGKFYKKKIICDANIHFDESKQLGEDVIFNTHYLKFINEILTYPESVYYYRDTPKSLSKAEDFNYETERVLYEEINHNLRQINNLKNYPEHIVYTVGRLQMSIYKNFKGKKRRKIFKKLLNEEYQAFLLLHNRSWIKYFFIFSMTFNNVTLLDFLLSNYSIIKKIRYLKK